jgi:hypothetical protein
MFLNPVRIGLNDVFYGNLNLSIVAQKTRKKHSMSKQKPQTSHDKEKERMKREASPLSMGAK